jgi:hypothetical protein
MKDVSVGKIIALALFMMVSGSTWACVDKAVDDMENVANCKKQAIAGDADGYLQLGKFFSQGRGVAQDYSRALENFQSAAERGNPEAPYFLSNLYLYAKGVKKDYRQVYLWRHIAGINGYPFGYMSRDQIVKKMKAVEITQAKVLVKNWLAEYRKPQPIKIIKDVVKEPVTVIKVERAESLLERPEILVVLILGLGFVLLLSGRSSGAVRTIESSRVTGVGRYLQKQAGKTRVDHYLDIQKALER